MLISASPSIPSVFLYIIFLAIYTCIQSLKLFYQAGKELEFCLALGYVNTVNIEPVIFLFYYIPAQEYGLSLHVLKFYIIF